MGQSPSTSGLLTSPSRVIVSHKAQGLSDEDAHKLLTLECLFKALDTQNENSVDRQIITDWISSEPYLQDPSVKHEADLMVKLLSHDEGGDQCSYREFVLAFLTFTTYDVQLLAINILRSANTDEARTSYIDPSTATEGLRAASYSDIFDDFDSRSFFLLDTIFTAMDTDEDDCVDKADYIHWFSEDSWFDVPDQAPLSACINQIVLDVDIVTRLAFLQGFSTLSRRYIKQLLTHLLHRSTYRVIRQARLNRKKSAVLHRRGSSSNQLPGRRLSEAQITAVNVSTELSVEGLLLQSEALETEAADQDEALAVDGPVHHRLLARRHSVMIKGDTRQSSGSGLRLCLLGQCMIQHSLFNTERGRSCIDEMKAVLQGDVVFSELETAIYPSTHQSVQNTFRPADSVFFHAAPAYVIDCVQSFGVNLFGLSNNHAFDVGVSGIHALINAMKARNLTFAGIGINEAEASAPAFKATSHGRIGLVSFACKVPPGSDAGENRPGVNAVWMEDLDSQKLRKQDVSKVFQSILAAKAHAELVITYNHNHYRKQSNINEISEMAPWARRLAHKCIDAGSHLYICHGDPRLQGIEVYKHGLIFYGLGSFIFQTRTPASFYGSEVWEGVIVQLHCRQGINPIEVEPVSPTALFTPPASPRESASGTNDYFDVLSAVASYSVKLIPIVLNEIGDGFDPLQHENAVKGSMVADKATRSNLGSPVQQHHTCIDTQILKVTPGSPLRLSLPTQQCDVNGHHSSRNFSAAGERLSKDSQPMQPPEVLSEKYELHLATRGLPKLASRSQAITILNRLQELSRTWGTVIQIDDPFGAGDSSESVGVVGWVQRVAPCQHSISPEMPSSQTTPQSVLCRVPAA